MPAKPSESVYNETLINPFDLDLPVVREGEGPDPAPAPSYELMLAHARLLIKSGLAPNRQPSSEPFRMD